MALLHFIETVQLHLETQEDLYIFVHINMTPSYGKDVKMTTSMDALSVLYVSVGAASLKRFKLDEPVIRIKTSYDEVSLYLGPHPLVIKLRLWKTGT